MPQKIVFAAVSADIEDAKTRRHFLHDSYSAALYKNGCVPLVVPAPDIKLRSSYKELAETIIAKTSGLFLTGGDDVNGLIYGGENLPFNGIFTEERDYFELELCRAAVRQKKPVLGICRGIQLLNAALGGTLFQDIEAEHSGKIMLQHRQKAPSWSAVHKVKLKQNSLIAKICADADETEIAVNSFHHQAVKETAPGFIASAFSSDGIIEAIEPGNESFLNGDAPHEAPHPFTLGVQWHPERMIEHHAHAERLFAAFAEAAAGL